MTGDHTTAAEKPNAAMFVLAINNKKKQQIDGFGIYFGITFAFQKEHLFLIAVVIVKLCGHTIYKPLNYTI